MKFGSRHGVPRHGCSAGPHDKLALHRRPPAAAWSPVTRKQELLRASRSGRPLQVAPHPLAHCSHAARSILIYQLHSLPTVKHACMQVASRSRPGNAVSAPSAATCPAPHRAPTAKCAALTARSPTVQPAAAPEACSTSTGSPAPSSALSAAALMALLAPPAALADTAAGAVAYDNTAGSESLKTVFGVGYAALVAVFAIRLLRRRAARAKSEVRLAL